MRGAGPRRRLSSALVIAVSVGLLTACGGSLPLSPGQMIRGEAIVSKALAGNLLGDPAVRDISLYLPPGYDKSQQRYPVLYVLQSFRGSAVNPAAVSEALDRAIVSGRSRAMILVFVDGFNALGGSWYLSSPTIGDWDSYITQEVVAHVDGQYRTLPSRDSRAITGCSMGGYGALHLGLRHPDVYAVAVGNSASFGMWSDASWEQGRREFTEAPAHPGDVSRMPLIAAAYIGLAAAQAPSPSSPPLFFDLPFHIVDGKAEIAADVRSKIEAVSLETDVRHYLAQESRLRALMIYHGSFDGVQFARAFDRFLSESGVPHRYLEVSAFHCALEWEPVLEFVSANIEHSGAAVP